jgi:fimbrial chaperone protein
MMRTALTVLAVWLLAVPLAAAAPPAMEIAPTTLDLVPGEAGLFYITNRSEAPVTAQLEALDWSQAAGSDRLTPSKTLVVSPPFATLAPGQRQVVRVLSPGGDDGAEIVHRLRISQLPEPDPEQGIRVLLQISIPVFVGSKTAAPPVLAWDGTQRGGDVALTVRNDGAQSVKLEGIATADGQMLSSAPLYVLPGAAREVLVPDGARAAGSELRITAKDGRSGLPVSADLVLHR